MSEPDEPTYPVRAVVRLTGLTPDLLRAWERRYRVVEPLRSEGGTRRYRASDLERLRLLKAAVDAGHRISELAGLDPGELARRATAPVRPPGPPVAAVLRALERLDGGEAEQILAGQLATLGPTRFAREFALPLLEEIGEAWESERLCVASEHLGSALLRSLLGSSLRPTHAHRTAPLVVFATPAGERHEIGLLIAALTALGAGVNPLYLGVDLPTSELLRAVDTAGAAALALSVVALAKDDAEAALRALRGGLPPNVELWLGGAGARALALPEGVRRIDSLESLEHRAELLRLRAGVR